LTWHTCGILLTKKIRHLGFHIHIESRWKVGFLKLTCPSMASIPEGRALAMDGRRWEVGTDGRPARGERSRERTACGQPVVGVGSFRLPPNPRRCAWVSSQRSGREPTFKFGYQNVTDPAVHLP
jgi:hypothetical protein